MSESKLTKVSPAPWKAVGRSLPEGGLDYWVEDANGDEILALYSCDGSDEPVPFPMDGNAHLISAAPDLLTALQKSLAHMEMNPRLYRNRLGEWVPLVHECRAVIAKAEGHS